MNEQQLFSFCEPETPNIEIIEIQATEEQKKEIVNGLSEIIYQRLKEKIVIRNLDDLEECPFQPEEDWQDYEEN